MKLVWPTIEVLNTLDKAGVLDPRVKKELDSARSLTDRTQKIIQLAKAVELAVAYEPLIADAKKGFARGTPDIHKSATAKAKTTVYEVRSHTGAAWRGAVVCPKGDEDAWLVYADRHDLFHKAGPDAIAKKHKSKALGPSQLDRRVREKCAGWAADKSCNKQILDGAVDSLRSIAGGTKSVELPMPAESDFADAVVTMTVNPVIDVDADPLNAHEEVSVIRLDFIESTMAYETRAKLIRLLSHFLQPDELMLESLYRNGTFTLDVLVTQARLIHLLGTGAEGRLDFENSPPEPTKLHYALKTAIAEAYVEGCAVQAVCGRWWVPIGDEKTHSELPVCPECQAQQPFAQAIKALVRG